MSSVPSSRTPVCVIQCIMYTCIIHWCHFKIKWQVWIMWAEYRKYSGSSYFLGEIIVHSISILWKAVIVFFYLNHIVLKPYGCPQILIKRRYLEKWLSLALLKTEIICSNSLKQFFKTTVSQTVLHSSVVEQTISHSWYTYAFEAAWSYIMVIHM